MRRLAVVAVVVVGTASAAPRPTRLEMKLVDGTTIHIANEEGAINSQTDVSVTVELRTAHKVSAISVGMRNEHNLYVQSGGSYNTDEGARWTTKWTGTWSITGAQLHLALVLDSDRCKAQRTSTGAPDEVLPCAAASAAAELTCTTEQITLETDGATKPASVAAWRCVPSDATHLGESPAQWVLGKSTCIRTNAGRMTPMSYAPCRP